MAQPDAAPTTDVNAHALAALAAHEKAEITERAAGAVEAGDSETLRALLAAHGPGFTNEIPMAELVGNQDTLLHIATRRGHLECLQILLPHVELDTTNDEGLTPLMVAAEAGRPECAQILLEAGADPDQRSPTYDEETALIVAARSGNLDCVKLLLPLSDPNAESSGGLTALFYAASMESAECVSALLPLTAEDAVRRATEELITQCRGYSSMLPALDRLLVQLSEHGVPEAPELQAIAFEALGAERLPHAAAVTERRELSNALRDAERR